jgi:multiple sugar transport system substrate-binding protein/lactose/L-arabinose transport system substrate-binding protein
MRVFRTGTAGWGLGLALTAVAAAAASEPLTLDPARLPEDIRGDIQVWGWNIAAGSLNGLVPAFEARYPECRIHVNMTGANLQSRFLLSLSAGVGAPDISQLQVREAPRYGITGKLTDLTAVAQRYAPDFAPSFWRDCVHDGRIYAIPWDMGPCAVFYKRRVFARFQIDPETIETWDDFIAAGKLILERSAGKTKMMCIPTGLMSDLFEILVQQNSGQLFDDEGRIALYSPENVEVMDLLRKLIASGISANIPFFGHAFLASLKTDSVATYPMAAWFGGTIRDYAPATSGDWGIFRLPAFRPDGLRTSNLGGSVLVIPDQCAQKEAAWKYVEYALCTKEAQIEQYRSFDLFPALVTTHQDPFFDEPVAFFGNQQVRRLFSLDIDRIPPMNRTTDWMEAVMYCSQALSKWANGGMEASDAFLARLEAKLSVRLGRAIAPGSLSGRGGG